MVDVYRALVRDATDEYSFFKYSIDSLHFEIPDSDDGTICPACPKVDQYCYYFYYYGEIVRKVWYQIRDHDQDNSQINGVDSQHC
jgi:hypothetical protein